MANVYIHQGLATGLNDGTSWANAYQDILQAFTGTNISIGDFVYIKGDLSSSLTAQELIGPTDMTNPAHLIGVKAATTNEPPVASDWVPGILTGDSTRAYDQTGANAPPKVEFTNSGAYNFYMRGAVRVYGVHFRSGSWIIMGPTSASWTYNHSWEFTECEFGWNYATSADRGVVFGGFSGAGRRAFNRFNKCKFLNESTSVSTTSNGFQSYYNNSNVFYDCEFPVTSADPSTLIRDFSAAADRSHGDFRFFGCDLSAYENAILDASSGAVALVELHNSKLHASAGLTSGTPTAKYKIAAYNTGSKTGISTSDPSYEIEDERGTVMVDTAHGRTGGATDEETGEYSIALTPHVDGTRDGVLPLSTPWQDQWVASTSTNFRVYIANSSASTDKTDRFVWVELYYAGADGTQQYDCVTTQISIAATPTTLTDDTDSTWASGANNPQYIDLTIAPGYEGLVSWRLHYAEHFSSSPETLYVDPMGVAS